MKSIRPVMVVGSMLALAACASGPVELPEPRPLVLHSGARLSVEDTERFRAIYDTLNREQENIVQDPSFFINAIPEARDVYPWETLEMSNDTANISYQRTAPDIRSMYEVYAHLHLMKKMNRLDEWLPGAADATGWELERAIVSRVADDWLLGRAVFDLNPYVLLDRLIYAKEAGQLDALLLTLRADEFPEAREAWLEANPGAEQEFRDWYRKTFEGDPPEPPGGG